MAFCRVNFIFTLNFFRRSHLFRTYYCMWPRFQNCTEGEAVGCVNLIRNAPFLFLKTWAITLSTAGSLSSPPADLLKYECRKNKCRYLPGFRTALIHQLYQPLFDPVNCVTAVSYLVDGQIQNCKFQNFWRRLCWRALHKVLVWSGGRFMSR
jgi:hypothetical protein